MADWAPCYHWFASKTPSTEALLARIASEARRSGWADRWAARIGHVGEGLVQVQTATPWGHLVLMDADVEVCPANQFLSARGSGSFFAGFNHLLFMDEGRIDVERAAGLLGSDAKVWHQGKRLILALKQPIALTEAEQKIHLRDTLEDSTPMGRLIEALALSVEEEFSEKEPKILLGLRTSQHGCVHLGHIGLEMRSSWHQVFRFEVTGEYNTQSRVQEMGPSVWALGSLGKGPMLMDEGWPFPP